MVKKYLLLMFVLAAVIIPVSAYAIPQQINFQGRLTSFEGSPITTSTSVTFNLYNASSGGSPLWSTSTSVTPDKNGAFSVLLSCDSSNFDDVNNRWLEVVVNGQTLTPRQQFASVPFAYRAITAESLSGGATGPYVLKTGDTMTGTLTLESTPSLIIGNTATYLYPNAQLLASDTSGDTAELLDTWS